MAISVPDVEAAVRRKFNGISAEDFLSLFNQIHVKICSRVRLYPEETVTFTWTSDDVTAGRAEWPMPPKVKRGWQARYWESSSSSWELSRTNKDRLDEEDPDWRVRAAGSPQEWYEDGGNFGLVSKPSTAPTDGYPKVELYNTGKHELEADDDLPEQVSDMSAWEYGVKWKYAEDRGQDSAERFRQLHKAALKELSDDIASRNARDAKEIHVVSSPVVNL